MNLQANCSLLEIEPRLEGSEVCFLVDEGQEEALHINKVVSQQAKALLGS